MMVVAVTLARLPSSLRATAADTIKLYIKDTCAGRAWTTEALDAKEWRGFDDEACATACLAELHAADIETEHIEIWDPWTNRRVWPLR